jgi:CHAT domain-containing protein
MIKLYEILFDENQQVSVPVALKTAQNWLQNLTVKEAEKNLESQTFQQALIQLQQTLSKKELFELEDAIAVRQTKWKAMSPEDKPFNNPFCWAAFIASGV